MTDAELQRAAAAARRLVEAGEVDGPLVLSLVVWPTAGVVAALEERRGEVRRRYGPEVAAEARRLRGEGLTGREVAERLDVPISAVTNWLWPTGAENRRRTRREGERGARP